MANAFLAISENYQFLRIKPKEGGSGTSTVLARDMDLHGYLNRTTFQTLKLSSTPTCSSSRFLSPSLHKTHKFPFPRLTTKALSTSSAAVQTSPTTTTISDDQGHSFPSSLNSFFLLVCFSFLNNVIEVKKRCYCRWKTSMESYYRLQVDKG